jgi:hypothetical protein
MQVLAGNINHLVDVPESLGSQIGLMTTSQSATPVTSEPPGPKCQRHAIAGAGLVATAFGLATFALLGTVPDADDGGHQLTLYVTAHRTALLACSITLTLSCVFGLVFFVGLWRHLRPKRGQTALSADAGLAGAIMLFAMVGVAAGALQAEAFVAGRHGGLAPGLAQALSAMFVSVLNLSAAPTVLLAVGFAVPLQRGHGGLGRWLSWALLAVAVAHIGALGSVAGHGLFTPAGLFTYAAPALYTLWILAASVTLLRGAT